LYHMRGFFVSIHFGRAVMPWLAKWSGVGTFGTLNGVFNTFWDYFGDRVWAEIDINIKTSRWTTEVAVFGIQVFLHTGSLLLVNT
jgi:hypothetical protein